MATRSLTKHVRLLPAVMVAMAGLLAVKSLDLVQSAHAGAPQPTQAAQSAAPHPAKPDAAQAATQTQAADDPATDAGTGDDTDSASEVDVLTSLAKRRAALDARAKSLDMQANLLHAAEQRVDGKIADLKSLRSQIQALLGKRDAAEKAQVHALVKVYSAMKPRDAARIFNTLDEHVLLDVSRKMKPDALAAIMAAMQPRQAQALTVKLATRLNLPNHPELAINSPKAAAGAAPPPGG
jgi:flagellar motility protein MotE (MotC chaperone)